MTGDIKIGCFGGVLSQLRAREQREPSNCVERRFCFLPFKCSLKIEIPSGEPARSVARAVSSINRKAGQLMSFSRRIRTRLGALDWAAREGAETKINSRGRATAPTHHEGRM